MANLNKLPGLHRGPIDHKSSSVINLIADGTIEMGDVVELVTAGFTTGDIVPRVVAGVGVGDLKAYGIAVGGDSDGIYGNGSASTGDANIAALKNEGVVVVTQGRCKARVGGAVGGAVSVGDRLGISAVAGILQKGTSGNAVIAIALASVLAADTNMIPVDVQRSVVP